MKLDITKQAKESKEINYSFETEDAEVTLSGKFKKDGDFLVIDAALTGKAKVTCDITGEEFFDSINEQVAVKFISSIYEGFDKKYDIIELDGDYIDLDIFLLAEIDAFKLGFHRKESANASDFEDKEF